MKHIKFTYVDAVTGIPVTHAPAENGPVFPDVAGLEFVFALESRYPTNAPHFFGTCPNDSDTDIPGVLAEVSIERFEEERAAEILARVPQTVTMRQARLALHEAGLLSTIESVMGQADEKAQIEWEYAAEVHRNSPMIAGVQFATGMTDEEVNSLFFAASVL